MAKIGRNAPCPCGSGKKYKKCCLPLQDTSRSQQNEQMLYSIEDMDDLDRLSNSVLDLIHEGRLDEAEQTSHELLSRYPDQVDGFDRLAMVWEARGDKKRAAAYYSKAAAFAQSNPGFEQEGIDWYLNKAKGLESEE
jgi:tetratricopeptide (TPR) repeat protein